VKGEYPLYDQGQGMVMIYEPDGIEYDGIYDLVHRTVDDGEYNDTNILSGKVEDVLKRALEISGKKIEENIERVVYSEEDRIKVEDGLKQLFPYVKVDRSALGGEDKASILITVSLDPRESWRNGILQNSRYRQFHVREGGLESFSGYNTPKFRKSRIKSIEDVIKKLSDWKKLSELV
jgi:hypothetical protein